MTPPLRPLLLLCLLAGLAPFAAGAAGDPRAGRWAHEGSAHPTDPRVVWGRLDNGLRYALLPHAGAPQRVNMKLIVLAGSVDESDAELGLAHFTEHMAFHGSAEMDALQMLAFFRRLGAEYGSDVNAYTTFDSTTYSLDFRENDPRFLADGLRFFRGVAGSIKFESAVIDRERRVIFAEKRNRTGISDLGTEATLPVIFRGASFAHHSPIGTDETLRTFRREQFLEFYRRNYRPDLMVLVAAGDFDAAALEQVVREKFSSLPKPTTPVPTRTAGRPEIRGMRAGVYRVSGIGSAETLAASVVPLAPRSDPREVQLHLWRSNLAMELFSHRLRYLIPGAGAPQASYEVIMNLASVVASVSVPGSAWTQGVLGLDQAVREVLKRGFTAAEVGEFRTRYLEFTRHQIEQLPVMDPAELCTQLADSITEHTVFNGPAAELAWTADWLNRLKPDELNRAFRDLWQPDAMAFHVTGDVDLELKPDDLVKTVQKNRRGEISYFLPPPPKDEPFVLKKPGPTATLAETRAVPELGAELLRLTNNVRVNFIPTKNEPGLVHAIIRIGDGLLTMPGQRPALKEFGLNTLMGSGTIFYQPDELAQIIDRRLLAFSFDLADNDAFAFRGQMAARNLETFLGIATEIVRSPKFNPYAHQEQRMRAAMGRAGSTMGFGEGQRQMMDHLFQGDARFMSGTPKDYASLGVADVRQWMEPALTAGYLEVTIVGDIPREAALTAVTRTLGTLAPRAATKDRALPPLPVKVAAPAGFRRFEFIGELNLGMVRGNWPVTGRIDARANAALQVLSKLVEFRIRSEVRDARGFSYGPSTAFDPYGGFDDFGMMQATIDCTPADAQQVAQLVQDTAATFAATGADAEEFEGGRGIVRSQLRQGFKDNGFLVNLFKRAQERPGRIDEILALHTGLVDQLTLEEVNAWAAKIFPVTNARTIMIVPKPFVGIFDGTRQ
ncbi:Peptidase M16 inactive domain protein [Lacunisphaera limnophila]|uniref:Peptidase M16 inactive domain protein n=1 Tax=Lacunisphaera limnophila TaxID=1838286 RepID=A0A1D8AT97_9BACT|nr:M16 family metallopeptidase [Lacunisphaera limnophila]AOS44117.1 Peptidase M16 inactive domain protein [Lacunisphaera limnophila]